MSATIMQTELTQLAAQAYSETKRKDDPEWADVSPIYQATLMTHAEAIRDGHPPINPTPFETRVTELLRERQNRSYVENVKAEQDAILKQKTENTEAAKAKFDEDLKLAKEQSKAAIANAEEIEKNDPDYKGNEGSKSGSASKAAAKGGKK